MARRQTSTPTEADPQITKSKGRVGRPSNAEKARANMLAQEKFAGEASMDEAAMEQARAAAPSARTAPRARREAPREIREPVRKGALVVTGRDGEQLSRRRTAVGDVHFVPPNEIPHGWDYQWNTVTVVGQEFPEEQQIMQQNGWRPVPAERHSGRWYPPGYKGAIVVKGLRLEERPTELGNEARAEDIENARKQHRDQTEVLKLSKKLPTGMATGGNYRGTGADVRMTIDKGLDIPRPQHQIEE